MGAYLQAFGLFSLGIALFVGFCYWIGVMFKSFLPDLKYTIKYKVFRKKHDPEIVANLFEDLENGVDEKEMQKTMILQFNNTKQVDEILYIYRQLKKIYMKGGNKNE